MSKTDGRVGKTTNMIIGGTVADESAKDWLELDQKVYHAEILFFFCPFLVLVADLHEGPVNFKCIEEEVDIC